MPLPDKSPVLGEAHKRNEEDKHLKIHAVAARKFLFFVDASPTAFGRLFAFVGTGEEKAQAVLEPKKPAGSTKGEERELILKKHDRLCCSALEALTSGSPMSGRSERKFSP